MIDESIFVELDSFEPAKIKQKLNTFHDIRDKIKFAKDILQKVIEELHKIGRQIEEYDRNPIGDDKRATQFVSITNYKFLLLRNSKFAILEELVELQSEYIKQLTNNSH